MSHWTHDNFYKENPANVLGEPYETSGRFGKVTKYRGTLDAALARMDYVRYEAAEQLSPFVSWEHQPATAASVTPDKARRIKNALDHAASDAAAMSGPAADIVSFEEVDATYNAHLSDDEKRAFVWYMMHLGRPMQGGWKKYHTHPDDGLGPLYDWVQQGIMCVDEGDFVPAFIYLSGNVYLKKSHLEKSEEGFVEQFGRNAYTAQWALLDAKVKQIYDKRLTLDAPNPQDRLRLVPTSDFAQGFMIAGLKGEQKFKERLSKRQENYGKADIYNTDAYDHHKKEIEKISLPGAFVLWMKNNSRNIAFRKGTTWHEIASLYIDDKKRGKDDDPDQFKKRKSAAREEGVRLFGEFLANELDLNDKVRIETQWNMQFNADLPMDFTKVPIGFRMARTYGGVSVDIRPEKREAIAFALMQGSGCLAYGVGLGKTWCASFILAQFLENGWCKRPLLVTPNQVYKQFMKEAKGLIPWLKINDFYNLADEYLAVIPKEEVFRQEKIKTKTLEIEGESVEVLDRANMDIEYKALPVEENSVTCLTYEGFRRLGIRLDGEGDFKNTLLEILEQKDVDPDDRVSQKAIEAFSRKIDGIIGRSQTGARVYLQDLGIDFLAIDEAHSAKKIFTVVAGKKRETLGGKEKEVKSYKITAGEPSYMGLKAFMFAQFIQKSNLTGNVLLLTATPFTNSPLEVYSMLALTGYRHLKAIGLDNLADFFDNFIEVRNELVIDSALNPVYKEIFTGFTNLPGLQGLIRRFFLYKFSTKETKRPNKIVLPMRQKLVDGALVELSEGERVDTILPLSPVQRVFMDDILAYAAGKKELVSKGDGGKYVCNNSRMADAPSTDDDDSDELTPEAEQDGDDTGAVSENSLDSDEKAGVRLLRAANYARALALSPYLYACHDLGKPDYKSYVETSSKLTFTMQCIASVKDWHERKGEPVSGQVVYMNRGVEFFELLKEYLVKVVGFKDHEVGIIKSSMPKGLDKSAVQDLFLGRRFNSATREYEPIPDQFRIKVLLGSATIKEGINLQTHSTVLYNLYLDWNPTDVVQLEGRIWRQGNLFKNVRIVCPLMEDSMDIFMFQKLEEKTRRINAIWDYDGNVKTLNLEEFDPKELKYALIKDPKRVAELEVREGQEAIENDISILRTQLNVLQDFDTVREKVFSKWTMDRLIKIATYFRNVTEEEMRNDPNRLQRTLLDIWKKQTLKDGTPAKSLEKETTRPEQPSYGYGSYGYRNSYGSSWTNPYEDYNLRKGEIQQHYGFSDWNDALRRYNRTVNDVLKPRHIDPTEAGVKFAVEKLESEIKQLEEEKKKLASEEAIGNRAKQIQEERERTGYQPSTVPERVAAFARLNYFLAEKQVKITTENTKTAVHPATAKLLELQQKVLALRARLAA